MNEEEKNALQNEAEHFVQQEDALVNLVHHSQSIIARLLQLTREQQAKIERINTEANEASVVVQCLRDENERLSKMLAGDLPV